MARAENRDGEGHAELKVHSHHPGGKSMYGSNAGEKTTYECTKCGAILEYTGDDRTECRPFWVQRGFADAK